MNIHINIKRNLIIGLFITFSIVANAQQIADKNRVPPYVVFSDATLKEMVRLMPKNEAEFLKVSGVGSEKLRRYGDDFLRVISGQEQPKIFLSSTYEQTKRLWMDGLNIEQIAKNRKLAQSSVISHLEKLITSGFRLDADKVTMEKNRYEKIKLAFEKSEGKLLTPVKTILGDDYSYDEIRLARLFI